MSDSERMSVEVNTYRERAGDKDRPDNVPIVERTNLFHRLVDDIRLDSHVVVALRLQHEPPTSSLPREPAFLKGSAYQQRNMRRCRRGFGVFDQPLLVVNRRLIVQVDLRQGLGHRFISQVCRWTPAGLLVRGHQLFCSLYEVGLLEQTGGASAQRDDQLFESSDSQRRQLKGLLITGHCRGINAK